MDTDHCERMKATDKALYSRISAPVSTRLDLVLAEAKLTERGVSRRQVLEAALNSFFHLPPRRRLKAVRERMKTVVIGSARTILPETLG